MEVGIAVFVAAALIIIVWIMIEMKRVRHKVFALFLIGVIIFLFLSSSFVFKDYDIDFKSVSGITAASKIYLSWLGSAFTNFQTTINAVKTNWEENKTNDTAG